MILPLLTDSAACRSRRHCGRCRDLEGGRSWRASLSRAFVLPAGGPDFPCPHGIAWGEKPAPAPAKSRGLGDTIAKLTKAVGIKPCGACKKRQAALNKLLPYRESAD